MNHPRHSLLERYALGELSADECLAIDEHIETCTSCAAQLDDEREVNDWIVQTSAEALPAGTSRRIFDELWTAVDAEGDLQLPVAPSNTWRNVRRAAAVFVLAAATWWGVSSVVLKPNVIVEPIVGVVPDDEPTAPPSDPTDASEPDPVEPEVPAMSAWEQRLAAALENPGARSAPAWTSDEQATTAQLTSVRGRVAAMLVEADVDHPADDEAFLAACRTSLAELRAEGWAAEQLVGGILMRGDDEVAARVALRSVLVDESAEMTLARAVADDRWLDAILVGLRDHSRDLSTSPALGRALSRRLDDSERSADVVALLNARGGGAWIDDVLAERVVEAVRRPSEERLEAAFELARVASMGASVTAWIDLAEGTGDPRASRGFTSTLAAEREATLAVVAEHMNDPRRRELVVEWIFEHELGELAPQLVALASERADAEIAEALPGLADVRATAPLFEAWREHRGRPLDHLLVEALAVLLIDHAASRKTLAGMDAVDDVVDVLEQALHAAEESRRAALREASADVLLRVATTPDLEASRRARVLGSLARFGSERHGLQLLETTRVSTDALSWLTAALLAPEASLEAFASTGGDPRVLAASLDDLSTWPAGSVAPSSRALRSVEQALSRLAAVPANPSLPNAQGDDE